MIGSLLTSAHCTVDTRISTEGAYFKFRRWQGVGGGGGGGGGGLFNFSQIMAWHDNFFHMSSAHEQVSIMTLLVLNLNVFT